MSKYIGTPVVSLSTDTVDVTGDITTTDATPEVIIVNDTHEDTDGGREGKVTFKGQQSGGEETTLAQIQASHDGTSDDEKGDLIFKTNDGSDGTSPTTAMVIDSAQTVGIGTAAPSPTGLAIVTGGGSKGVMLTRNDGSGNPTSGQGFGSFGFKGIMDGTNSMAAAEASIEAIAAENHSGSTAGTNLAFYTKASGTGPGSGPTERMRITSGGDLQIGTTTDRPDNYNGSGSGTEFSGLGLLRMARNGDMVVLNRISTDGDVLNISKDGSAVGQLRCEQGDITIGTGDVHLRFNDGSDTIQPRGTDAAVRDNAIDLGSSSQRFDDIFATNGTINTSDENEKQNIASLTSAEISAATAISKLFKTFKWKDKVAAKGDDARTHTGVVAQQVKSAMSDAGLDASKYAFWCSDTWWETQTEVAAVEADEKNAIKAKDAYTRTDVYEIKDEAPEGATERTRMGVRYPELLAFIGAATEQRLTSIESRLTALEGE